MNTTVRLNSLWKWILLASVAAVLLTGPTTFAGDQPVTFELTGTSGSISYADDADWGFWSVDRYDSWYTEDEDKKELVEGRFSMVGSKNTVFIAFEQSPTLHAIGQLPASAGGDWHDLSADLQSIDLALGQWYRPDRRSGLFSWLGTTYMHIEEKRLIYPQPGADIDARDKATSRLWGVAAGLDGELMLSNRLAATGRVVVRWAKGKRRGVMQGIDPDGGGQDVIDVKISDSTTRVIYGGELGLRWSLSESMRFAGGWRYRDWQYDDGPATCNGPFLRLQLDF